MLKEVYLSIIKENVNNIDTHSKHLQFGVVMFPTNSHSPFHVLRIGIIIILLY